MTETFKHCEHCGRPLAETSPSNTAKHKFCSDKCRYAHWKQSKREELMKLVTQLAGRGIKL